MERLPNLKGLLLQNFLKEKTKNCGLGVMRRGTNWSQVQGMACVRNGRIVASSNFKTWNHLTIATSTSSNCRVTLKNEELGL